MSEWLKALQDYFFLLVIGFMVGIMFLIKGYEKEQINTREQLIRYTIHGILISMFITWVGFELFLYFGLPYKLSVALGGAIAYLGTEKLTTILERVIQKYVG